MAKSGQVDFEIIGLTGIVKKKNRKEAEHTARRDCFQQPGELNESKTLFTRVDNVIYSLAESSPV